MIFELEEASSIYTVKSLMIIGNAHKFRFSLMIPFNTTFYAFFQIVLQMQCFKLGGFLATIENSKENTYIINQLKAYKSKNLSANDLYVFSSVYILASLNLNM